MSYTPDALAMNIPILVTDGKFESEIIPNESNFTVKYQESTYTISPNKMDNATISQKQFANQRSLYKLLLVLLNFFKKSREVSVSLSLK